MKLNSKTRKMLNTVCSKYTSSLITYNELHELYDSFEELGIEFIVHGDCTVQPQAVPFTIDGEQVENSRLVWGYYYPNSNSKAKFELTAYFS